MPLPSPPGTDEAIGAAPRPHPAVREEGDHRPGQRGRGRGPEDLHRGGLQRDGGAVLRRP